MKRISAFIMAIVMLFCVTIVSANQSTLTVEENNSHTSEYELSVNSPQSSETATFISNDDGSVTGKTELAQLKEMGIMTTGEGGPFDTVTRGEMAKIICDTLAINGEQPAGFSDVSPKHPYISYIGAAQKQNIMCGYGNGLFMPDNEITYYEFIKVVITMLGYQPAALSRQNGYPYGYLYMSEKIGLYIYPAAKDAPITRNEMAKIILKALDIPVMMQVSYGATEEYSIMNGENGARLVTLKTMREAK